MARMKGQAYVLPETLIDVIQLITFIALFVGTFLIFTTYNLVFKNTIEEREVSDLINIILGDRCLLANEDGNYFRGIFDAEKLKKGAPCVSLGKYSIIFEDIEGNVFSLGSCNSIKHSLPVVIKNNDRFNLGKMVVCY